MNDRTGFAEVVGGSQEPQRLIAWCPDDETLPAFQKQLKPGVDTLILIGPEGDFAPGEVALAKQCGFTGINLGPTRLRTETAGLVAVMGFQMA